MATERPMTSLPEGLIQVPVTPFTADNEVDLPTFDKVIEFLLGVGGSALCVNLHLAESLNLTLEERKLLAERAVAVSDGRAPVIVHVATAGTDQAIDLARHAEQVGADAVISVAPYYWRPSQDALYDHFAAIMSATGLPFIGYNSPGIMAGVGLTGETLGRLLEDFPQFLGLKEASHNWETYLELGIAGRKVRPDFGLFVGTEWIIPSLTLGGTACMSVQSGIAPNLVKALYAAVKQGDMAKALPLQETVAELYKICKTEYPAPTKAMWEIMGRPVGNPRLPNRPLTDEQKASVRAALDRLGLLDSEPHGWNV